MNPNTAVPLAESDLPVLDFTEEGVAVNPYPALRRLARESWIVTLPIGYAVVRWEECKEIMRDRRFRPPIGLGLSTRGINEGLAFDWAMTALISQHGENHSRLRRIVASALSPQQLEAMRPFVHTLAEEIADRADGATSGDGAEFTKSFSVKAICELMGWPADDWGKLAEWSNLVVQLATLSAAELWDRIETAVGELHEYTAAHLDHVRAQKDRGNGIAGILVDAEERGEITERECVALCENLLVGGAETTMTSLNTALWLLANHPADWQALAEDESLAAPAVEEVLRIGSAQLGTARVALEDVEINGTVIPEGTFLLIVLTSANLDELAYQDPKEFDIRRLNDGRRAPKQGHLTFGSGIHVCVGQHLARLELQEALKVLPKRWPNLRMDESDQEGVQWNSAWGIHGVTRVPLQWDAVS
jgi:cytochrome P450